MADDDDHDIPETGAVFTFGKSKFADNIPGKFWIRNDRFLKVSCGDEHTALVAESGRLFTFGSNDWGQLGVGNAKASSKPTCVKSLKTHKIAHVACGRSHTIVATKDGKLFTFGANNESQLGAGSDSELGEMSLSPVQLECLDAGAFKMLSAGTEHSAALTDDGRLYVWGGGSEGQLGLGEDVQEVKEPRELLLDSEVVCVSCGYYHTAVVTASGRLYTFGETDCGKLGYRPDEEDEHYSPQHIDSIPGKVRAVACGGSHTMALTDDGKIYSFGDGPNGQLGHGNTTLRCNEPKMVASLSKHRVVTVQCGENHSSVITERGAMFAFGDGRHGKLGLGQENFANQFKPLKVQRFQKFVVEELSCGGCHTLILAKPRMQNGEISSSESEDNQVATNTIRRSQTLHPGDEDGEMTLTPRERRQNKALAGTLGPGSPMLNRTLPALRSLNKLPHTDFAATIAADRMVADKASTQRSELPIPTIRMDNTTERRSRKGSDSESEDESQSSPAKKPPQKRTPFHRTRSEDEKLKKKRAKGSDGESDEEEDDEDEKQRPVPKRRPGKGKPEPVPRHKKPSADDEESEEDDSEEKESKDSEDTEEEDDKKKSKKKGKDKKKDDKKKPKKGIFGKKKKSADSEDEDEDEESEDEDEEDSEDDAKKKKKSKEEEKKRKEEEARKKKESKKKEKEKKGKKGKEAKKEAASEDEDEASSKEEEKIESVVKAPDASEPVEIKLDEVKEPVTVPVAPPPQKKSKLCSIL